MQVPNAVVREAAEERQANSERNETLQEENPSRVDTNSHKVIPVAEHETKGGEEVDSLQRVISKEAAERAKQNKKDSLGYVWHDQLHMQTHTQAVTV